MTTDDVRQKLMEYFACIAYRGRVYGLREFNTQVMMNVYDPHDRAALATALDELDAAGVIQRYSSTEYTLTDAGLALARHLREQARAASDHPMVAA